MVSQICVFSSPDSTPSDLLTVIVDHRLFQSLVYGQDLAHSVKVKKVSSSLGPEADSTYIRVWKTRDPACKRSMLFYASNRSKPRKHGYVTIAGKSFSLPLSVITLALSYFLSQRMMSLLVPRCREREMNCN